MVPPSRARATWMFVWGIVFNYSTPSPLISYMVCVFYLQVISHSSSLNDDPISPNSKHMRSSAWQRPTPAAGPQVFGSRSMSASLPARSRSVEMEHSHSARTGSMTFIPSAIRDAASNAPRRMAPSRPPVYKKPEVPKDGELVVQKQQIMQLKYVTRWLPLS